MLFQITPYAISGLLIFLSYIFFVIILLTIGRSKLTKIMVVHYLCVCIWGVGAFLIGTIKDPAWDNLIWHIFYPIVLFIPPTFIHVIQVLTKEKNKIVLWFGYLQAILFTILTFTGHLITEVFLAFNSLYFFKGTFFYLLSFILWIFLISFAHTKLLFYYSKPRTEKKQDIYYIYLSIPLGFVGGITNFLPGTLGLNIYPFGNFLIPIYGFLIIYATVKYNLFDISIAFKKGFIYSLLIAIISLAYLLVVFIIEKITQEFLGYRSTFSSVIFAFILGLVLIPLKNWIQDMTERYFFNISIDKMAEQNELLRHEVIQKEKYKLAASLAGGIAHEIKNPLTALQIFCSKILEKKDDPEFLQKYQHITALELARIESLAKDLTDFAKPSSPLFTPIELNKLFHETLELVNAQLKSNKISLKLTFSDDITLHADKNQLKQALLNIILNAIDAMPQGGTITIKTTPHAHKLEILIKDTGHGINPEDIKHIFEPFYSRKSDGTGLGLAITETIIKRHHGEITVRSSLNKGTEFKITLPTVS